MCSDSLPDEPGQIIRTLIVPKLLVWERAIFFIFCYWFRSRQQFSSSAEVLAEAKAHKGPTIGPYREAIWMWLYRRQQDRDNTPRPDDHHGGNGSVDSGNQ
jgi:hypothetical protein